MQLKNISEMRKRTYICLVLVALLSACNDDGRILANPSVPETTSGTTIKVDFSDSGLPVLDIKRGYILRDAISSSNSKIKSDLQAYADMGMQLVALPKDLNQFDANWTSNPQGDYFRSYRSMGSQYFGGNGEKEEFSRNQDGGIDVHINSQYLELCQMARDLGFQLIVQCSGVPVEGKNNGRVEHLFPLDSRRSFHGSARYYPLPATNNYDANGTIIFEWMKLLHDKLGVSNTIYAGNQEPSHTTGYFNGTQTETATIQNLTVYPAIWRSTANKLKNAGMLSAVSQLNEVSGYYDASLQSIIEKGVPFDYYSIQNYMAQRNSKILADVKNALVKYDIPLHKKVLFNRYDYGATNKLKTNEERFATAPGIIAFLESELILCDYADMVYGYCFFAGAQNYSMMNSVLTFLNSMPQARKRLSGIPEGLKYIASADENKISIVLWNPGSEHYTFNLDTTSGVNTSTNLTVEKGTESNLIRIIPATSGSALKEIAGLRLNSQEFMLITIVF